jgi:hypothetical protein
MLYRVKSGNPVHMCDDSRKREVKEKGHDAVAAVPVDGEDGSWAVGPKTFRKKSPKWVQHC